MTVDRAPIVRAQQVGLEIGVTPGDGLPALIGRKDPPPPPSLREAALGRRPAHPGIVAPSREGCRGDAAGAGVADVPIERQRRRGRGGGSVVAPAR